MTWSDAITEEEREVVEELKRLTIKDCPPKMLQDDSVFYRFCKARDFNLKDAEEMLRKHLVWRKEYQIESILTDYTPNEVMKKYCTLTFLGFDKDGDAVKHVDFGRIDSKGFINSVKQVDIFKYNLLVNEQDLEMLRQHSKKIGRQVNKITFIYNLEDITLAKVTYKKGVDYLILAAKMYQDNYPEIIKTVYFINGSSYFTLLYSILKNFLAPALQAKIRVFGPDGYQETLLQTIDADVLPKFLGGNRTDPDGNPNCYTIIKYGKEISHHHYRTKSHHRTLTHSTRLAIARYSKSAVPIHVSHPGSVLEWAFETQARDIGFGLQLEVVGSNPEEVIPVRKVDTSIETETGVYECEKAGIYILVFDNTYSWLHPKEVFYKVRIVKPNEVENIS